jgi:hypothetical protein
MKRVEPPQFLSDVYRDLRDRHLLIPVVVLVLGLLAVPMLLKSDAETVPPPPVTATGASSAETVPAVLAADDVSVRDYQQRLADLKSKNPFKQQFVPKPETSDTATADGSGLTDISSGLDAPTDTSITPGETGEVTDSTTTTAPAEPADVEVVTHLFTHRVDLQVGVQGSLQNERNVKPMTILPEQDNPVLAFLGTDERGKRAAFVVSSNATVTGGDGACVPNDTDCLYITLEKNENKTFFYAPDGQTYEVVLKAIKKVKL